MLEIGAGQGAVGARLAERFEYVGVEADATSAAVAQSRVEAAGGTLLSGDLYEVDIDGVFDIVCAFEVLEHIEDDRAALKDWGTRLTDSGRLLLSVPAHQHRYGAWDAAAGHYRRYGREELSRLLRECGFTDVQVFAYGFPLSYLLEAARDRIAARRARSHATPEAATATSGRQLQPPAFLGAATWVVTAPFRYAQRPFASTGLGTGLVATAVASRP